MRITVHEAAWFLPYLTAHARGLPSSRTFEPYYNATSWDFNDLMRGFREDAVRTGPLIWEACETLVATKKWPRMKLEPAFWLRERWQMAERYCTQMELHANKKGDTISPIRPEDPLVVLRFLIIRLWDTSLSDLWLRENARTYMHVESFADTDTHVEFEISMRKFEGDL